MTASRKRQHLSSLLPRDHTRINDQAETAAHVTITQCNTLSDNGGLRSGPSPTAKRRRLGTSESITNIDDYGLAQSLCSALFQASIRINKKGLPSWWSDIEGLKPKGRSLHDTDEALCVEELDQTCTKYSASLIYRASMAWLIRCFLEIIRRAFHQKSRANAKKHHQDKAGREQRCRVGELMVAIAGH